LHRGGCTNKNFRALAQLIQPKNFNWYSQA